MTLATQAKILRVLQSREVERVGGTTTVRVDVRIIASTNKDLLRSVREGSFRDDLYFRLNVITLNVPPLRERREEIPGSSTTSWRRPTSASAGRSSARPRTRWRR